jgi:hypothetical protein
MSSCIHETCFFDYTTSGLIEDIRDPNAKLNLGPYLWMVRNWQCRYSDENTHKICLWHIMWNKTSNSGALQMVEPHVLYRFYQRPTYWTHTSNNHIIEICQNVKSIVVNTSFSCIIIICRFLNCFYVCMFLLCYYQTANHNSLTF